LHGPSIVRIHLTIAAVLSAMMISTSGQGAADPWARRPPPEERRPEWLYFDVEGGGIHASMRTFFVNEDTLSVTLREVSADGPMVGLGAGFRFSIVTLGPRLRYAPTDAFKLLGAGGELGVRIPLGRVEPHFRVGAGYVGMSGATSPDSERRPLEAHGYYGRIGGGVDFRILRSISVGAFIGWEYLGVVPDGISVSSVSAIQAGIAKGDFLAVQNEIRKAEGSSFGSIISYGVTFGLHY
jgi:hypothetical protein